LSRSREFRSHSVARTVRRPRSLDRLAAAPARHASPCGALLPRHASCNDGPMSTFGPLVNPEWLRRHMREADLRVIDFRWYLTGRQGRDAYLGGHIPGAVFVDLDAVTGEGPG